MLYKLKWKDGSLLLRYFDGSYFFSLMKFFFLRGEAEVSAHAISAQLRQQLRFRVGVIILVLFAFFLGIMDSLHSGAFCFLLFGVIEMLVVY